MKKLNNSVCELKQISSSYYQIILSSEEDPYLSHKKLDSLKQIFIRLNSMKEVKIVEIKGDGTFFSAGGNLDFFKNTNAKDFAIIISKIPEMILNSSAITVANMKGHAIGGGLAIGLWTDLPCLCETSLYGANFMSLGFTPGMGSTIILEKYFGLPLAMEMMYTGSLFKGRDLKKSYPPIASRIYKESEYNANIEDLINKILETDENPLKLFKNALSTRRLRELKFAIKQEVNMHKICFTDSNTIKKIVDQLE